MTPACPAHRALVEAAMEPHASDVTLERYAREVPSCPACALQLAVAVGAHPGAWRLRHRERPSPPRTAIRYGLASAIAALAAAAVAIVALAERPQPRPVAEAPPPLQAIARPAPPRSALVPVAVAPSVARLPAVVPPRAVMLARVSAPASVAEAPSWPEPPFVDLRAGGRPKSPGSSVSSVGLSLVGEEPWAVGDAVAFTVTASRESALVLCVEGPEEGPIWRGAVSAGRTPLAREGRAQRFAFGAPGRYRFAVVSASADGPAPACDDAPFHVVEVEVSP